MTEQEKYATAVMEEWLSHPQELGAKPTKLEIAGTFELHGLRYYIFKFKKSVFGSWKVAVCGGYEGEGLGHCGHIFSEMEAYDPATAQEKCVAMVEKIRQYWSEQASQQGKDGGSETQNQKGFLGFVLLSTPEFQAEAFREAVRADWGIACPRESGHEDSDDNTIVFEEEGMLVTIGLMEAKVPDGEAEYWANSNYITRDASVAAAQAHVAHLLVAVLGQGRAPADAGILFVKIASACLKASNALGIYTRGTVWLPENYIQNAMVIKAGEFPMVDLVFVGLYRDEKGVSSWTNGLRSFGKTELEVICSRQSPSDVLELMYNISAYLIQQGAVLRSGETLGYTAEQKLPLTLSEGVYIEGETMKIGF